MQRRIDKHLPSNQHHLSTPLKRAHAAMLNQFLASINHPLSPTAIGGRYKSFQIKYKTKRILAKCNRRDSILAEQLSKEGRTLEGHFENITGVSYRSYQAALTFLKLENTKIICPVISGTLNITQAINPWERDQIAKAEDAYQLCKSTFSKYQTEDAAELALYEAFADMNANSRKLDMVQRLTLEVTYAVAKQHTIVFDTLTVDDQNYQHVFVDEPNSSFTNYIKRFKKLTSEDAYYFGVVEAGGKNGRLHIHVVWFIPLTAHDLRWAQPDSNPRSMYHLHQHEIGSLEVWPYGVIRKTKLVRWGGDLWSKYHTWPVSSKDPVKPVPASPGLIVGYVVKYITKDVLGKQPEGYKRWRVRKTQRLGLRFLKPLLDNCSLIELVALANLPSIPETRKYRAMFKKTALTHLSRRLALTGPSLQEILDLPSRNVLQEALDDLRTIQNQNPAPAELPEINIGNSTPDAFDLVGIFDPETGALITETEWQDAMAYALKVCAELDQFCIKILDHKLPGATTSNDHLRNSRREGTKPPRADY